MVNRGRFKIKEERKGEKEEKNVSDLYILAGLFRSFFSFLRSCLGWLDGWQPPPTSPG